MTREEQIKEMLPYMCHCCGMEAGFGECAEMRDAEKCVLAREAAEALFDAGYRKGKPNELQAVAHDCGK